MRINIEMAEATHKDMKRKCFFDNISVSKYVRNLIEKDMYSDDKTINKEEN